MANAEFTGMMFGRDYQIHELEDDLGIIHRYRGLQTNLNRPVSVHVVAPQYRNDLDWVRGMVKGAEIGAQYAHPNIVPIYDRDTYDEVDYIVVRSMEGGSLRAKLKNGALEIPDVLSTVKQIAAALDYVHSLGSCHGDPATVNILYDAAGNAYVGDFYLLGYLNVIPDAGVFAGVPAFLAPERMLGQPASPLTDQFALASVSYVMLTGEYPWVDHRQREALTPPQTYRPEVPNAVNDVLFRAYARDAEERYPTILEFARQFELAFKQTSQQVFISYSQKDKSYVKLLRDYLQQNGLQVWFDERIEHGDHWFNDIHTAIKESPAVIVVMSPEAEQSEWVQKEILLAKRYRKPIFPMLLRGQELAILIDLQYEDVRSGNMPSPDFHRRIARAVYGV